MEEGLVDLRRSCKYRDLQAPVVNTAFDRTHRPSTRETNDWKNAHFMLGQSSRSCVVERCSLRVHFEHMPCDANALHLFVGPVLGADWPSIATPMPARISTLLSRKAKQESHLAVTNTVSRDA